MLIDAHIHIALNNIISRGTWEHSDNEKRKQCIESIFKEYKKRSILFLRDGGDGIYASSLAREAAEKEGIVYKSPIYALYKKGSYGDFLGRPVTDISSIKEELEALLHHRPDHIKIILTGIVNFGSYGDVGETTFSLEELKFIVDFAASRGLPVMVHANGCEGVERAIRAGVTTIEHGYLVSERELYGMAEKGIIWVPTLSPLGNILDAEDERFVNEKPVIKRVYEEQLTNIGRALEIGVMVALGSDAGAYRVGHGSGLLDEIRHFKKLGLRQEEIERMCFENGLKAMGERRVNSSQCAGHNWD